MLGHDHEGVKVTQLYCRWSPSHDSSLLRGARPLNSGDAKSNGSRHCSGPSCPIPASITLAPRSLVSVQRRAAQRVTGFGSGMSRFEVPLVMLRSRYLKLVHWRPAAVLVGTPFVMIMSICAMLPMHKDMEYRTTQNEKPRQPAQSVSTTLRDQVKGGDSAKAVEGGAARCKL